MAAQSHPNPPHTNRLARESSPYLLQHAHNPVDWYPWGPEAFAAAREQNRPIFLSVGYSTCYWCHVMERECFENEAIAAEMNRRFINIKVDREERPDVDQLYMTAVQVLTHHGGWPMSVFLTPDLDPFYGGTYFPPQDMHGRPGFPRILAGLDDAYHNRRAEVDKTASQLRDILQHIAEPPLPSQPLTVDHDFIEDLIARSTADYDPRNGGFGGAPKFPRQTLLELLLHYTAAPSNSPAEDSARPDEASRQSQVLSMLRHTLDAMAAGGIRDHLGGGFHRYSTDDHWLVPHFEIMLYDNAMLAWCYVEMYRQTEDRAYADVARGIFEFILREMTSPDGAFYTAFDAEVDAQEGLSYLWTRSEIEQLLSPEDAKLFCTVYGLDRGPNFADPHHGTDTPDRNILHLPEPIPAVAARLEVDPDELNERLASLRQVLLSHRATRKQPLLDTKIITSWNALMVRALAHGGAILQEQRYLDAAARCADFLLRQHRMPDGGLYRTSRDGVVKYEGFLDDYASLAFALVQMRQAGAGERWKEHAAAVTMSMLDRFRADDPDAAGGLYFTSKDATDLIVRQKTGTDSPLPSGNALAAMALLELDQPEAAREILAAFAAQLRQNGEGMSAMVQAALLYLREHKPFTVSPAAGSQAAADADRPLSPDELARSVVSIRTEWSSPTELRVKLSILHGFHINAHNAPGMVPTELLAGDGATVDYPPGQERTFPFADRPLQIYADQVTLAVRYPAPPKSPTLTLRYQPCDDTACLPPVTRKIEVGLPDA